MTHKRPLRQGMQRGGGLRLLQYIINSVNLVFVLLHGVDVNDTGRETIGSGSKSRTKRNLSKDYCSSRNIHCRTYKEFLNASMS